MNQLLQQTSETTELVAQRLQTEAQIERENDPDIAAAIAAVEYANAYLASALEMVLALDKVS